MRLRESHRAILLSGLLVLVLACSRQETEVTPGPASPPEPPTGAAVQEPPAQSVPARDTGPRPTQRQALPPLKGAATARVEERLSPATAAPAEASAAEVAAGAIPYTPVGAPPPVDTSIASVDLRDVVFDTFRGGFIRLSNAHPDDIEFLRDKIAPIYEPLYGSVDAGDWLGDDDLVIGYESPAGAFAYPINILSAHEIVHDFIDDVPLVVTYCPLCHSGVVYSRDLEGRMLLFGNTSALYESDMVMYDHQTGSYWFQVLGEAIVGPLTGKRLTMLPSRTITWSAWKELHPDTSVLRPPLGNPIQAYMGGSFAGLAEGINQGYFAFPVNEDKLDGRLRPGDVAYAVQVGDAHKAFALTGASDWLLNDTVGNQDMVVVARPDGPTAAAYFRSVNGRTLTFALDGGAAQDEQTGSKWSDSGKAVSGPLAGAQLTPVPSRTSFWFSLTTALPDIELHTPE